MSFHTLAVYPFERAQSALPRDLPRAVPVQVSWVCDFVWMIRLPRLPISMDAAIWRTGVELENDEHAAVRVPPWIRPHDGMINDLVLYAKTLQTLPQTICPSAICQVGYFSPVDTLRLLLQISATSRSSVSSRWLFLRATLQAMMVFQGCYQEGFHPWGP